MAAAVVCLFVRCSNYAVSHKETCKRRTLTLSFNSPLLQQTDVICTISPPLRGGEHRVGQRAVNDAVFSHELRSDSFVV